jgi:hypothetical protein
MRTQAPKGEPITYTIGCHIIEGVNKYFIQTPRGYRIKCGSFAHARVLIKPLKRLHAKRVPYAH